MGEAMMLARLNHPNIVKCHGVFIEKGLICIVMDKYVAGDLIGCCDENSNLREKINCHSVVNAIRQMAASIQYLSSKCIVHRDVKGDNILRDHEDITDPTCHVALADFGAACSLVPGQRLKDTIGTRMFWSPEFYDRNYGPKVDVWALGVVIYGLVSGRYPFRNEADVRKKDVQVTRYGELPPLYVDFVLRMLEKKEPRRLSADGVVSHAWLARETWHANMPRATRAEKDVRGQCHKFCPAIASSKRDKHECTYAFGMQNELRPLEGDDASGAKGVALLHPGFPQQMFEQWSACGVKPHPSILRCLMGLSHSLKVKLSPDTARFELSRAHRSQKSSRSLPFACRAHSCYSFLTFACWV